MECASLYCKNNKYVLTYKELIFDMKMSDIDSENGSNQEDDICRDYMRNVCSRGRKCRFKHPNKTQFHFAPDAESTKEERSKLVRMFCHDFQVNFIRVSFENINNYSESKSDLFTFSRTQFVHERNANMFIHQRLMKIIL